MFNFFKKKSKIEKKEKSFNYKKEVWGILGIASFIFIFLSLISYNKYDSSLFYFSSKSSQVTNWCGVLGANISAIFLYLWGMGAYFFIFYLLYISILLVFKKEIIQEWVNILFSTILVLSLTIFLRIFEIDFVSSFAGGLIGDYLFKLLVSFAGETGSIIIIFSLIAISIVILAQISVYKLLKESLFITFNFFKDLSIKFINKIKNFKFKKREKSDSSQDNIIGATSDPDKTFDWLNKIQSKSEILFCSDVNEPAQAGDSKLAQIARFGYSGYSLPDLEMFKVARKEQDSKQELIKLAEQKSKLLEEKLEKFGINGKVVAIKPGPVITLFEYKPEIDNKISKILSLEDDLAMALTANSIRILAPIPGKSVVGFEISNEKRDNVYIGDILLTQEYKNSSNCLPVALGVDVIGAPVIQDLSKMPHLLIAGSTGSGKSVGLNSIIVGLLAKFSPDYLKLILIDPKRLEFTPYKDIPHLLFPVITNPLSSVPVLKWLTQEMEERYDKMALAGVKSIVEYQKLSQTDKALKLMPYIVLVIDELADLMVVAGKDIEVYLIRIAQMARAAGIHMIVATQRPSIEVLTGLIKVNFPSRISFRVTSKIDSRTILDCSGAEKLLGKGDMLVSSYFSPDLKRVHGAYVSDEQIETLVEYLKAQREPEYLDLNEILKKQTISDNNDFQDDLYPQIVDFIKQNEEISISMIQRQYRIGFNRSARIIEKLEMDGLIAPAQGSKPRKVIR